MIVPVLPEPAVRRQRVLQALPLEGHKTARELAVELDLSVSTTKKALQELAAEGACGKVPAPAGSHYPWLGWRRA